MDVLIRTFHVVFGFLFKERPCDVSAWAIAFTMNTWGASLGRVRFQTHGTIRKAIDESRAKAKQARFLEQLSENQTIKTTHQEEVEVFKSKFDSFLTKLEKFDAKYPPLNPDEHGELCSTRARVILGFFAFLSVLCILFGWFYNCSLVVLFPYPALAFLYLVRARTIPRFIQKSYEQSERAFSLTIIEKPSKETISLDELAEKLAKLCGERTSECESLSQNPGNQAPSKSIPKKGDAEFPQKTSTTERMKDSRQKSFLDINRNTKK